MCLLYIYVYRVIPITYVYSKLIAECPQKLANPEGVGSVAVVVGGSRGWRAVITAVRWEGAIFPANGWLLARKGMEKEMFL